MKNTAYTNRCILQISASTQDAGDGFQRDLPATAAYCTVRLLKAKPQICVFSSVTMNLAAEVPDVAAASATRANHDATAATPPTV